MKILFEGQVGTILINFIRPKTK